jgi:hypothetical protein
LAKKILWGRLIEPTYDRRFTRIEERQP